MTVTRRTLRGARLGVTIEAVLGIGEQCVRRIEKAG